jgi:hypothetical protein
MTKIDDLKGFAFPTPEGKVSVVGDLPWHFGAEHLCVVYRTDPEALAAYLPDPLMPGDPLDRVIVDFGKWYSLWDRSTCRKTTPNAPGTRRPSCGSVAPSMASGRDFACSPGGAHQPGSPRGSGWILF